MDQGRNTGQASRHEHQCSEEAILWALELGMHCHEDGQRPENSNQPRRRVLNSSTRSEMRKNKIVHMEINHRPVDIAWQRFTPENHVYSQDKVAQYEDHYTQHVQSQAEMFHVLGVVHQGVVRRRQRQARDGRQHEDGESNEIGASDPGVSAGKVLLDIPLTEQEENGRDEVGIDVDRLVVDIRPTAERSVSRA